MNGFGKRRIFIASKADGENIIFCTTPHRSDDIRRGAGSGNAENYVVGRNMVLLQIAPAAFCIVFGMFNGFADGAVAAGNESDDAALLQSIRRRKLRSIHDTKPTARSG